MIRTIIINDDGRAMLLSKPDYTGEWWSRYFPGATSERVTAYRVFMDGDGITPNGIRYNDELSGPDGVHITMFPEDGTPREEITRAKAWLRNRRDVTGFTIRRVRWVEPAAGVANGTGM